jgi:hypothetical protein
MLVATASDTYHFLLKDNMCFINSPEYTYLDQREPTSTFKIKIAGSIPFKSKVDSHGEMMCYILQVLT